jgi:hypothetical protein
MHEQVRTAGVTMRFGRFKGQLIDSVPLGYLRWWKSQLIENLRDAGAEIERREAMGLTEEIETKLETLPLHVRDNLVRSLRGGQSDDDRTHALWLIDVKFREYAGYETAVPRCHDVEHEDEDEFET